MKTIYTLFFYFFIYYLSSAQDFSCYAKKKFVKNGDTLCYRILYPPKYNPLKKYPVITFLHGIDENGSDNELQLKHGGVFFASDSSRRKYDYITIFPQCSKGKSWKKIRLKVDSSLFEREFLDLSFSNEPTLPIKLVKSLLDSLVKSGKANSKRMYLGGLSTGGFGVYDMIERYPNYFAAAFPMCGAGDITKVNLYAKKLPIWIFHGGADLLVSVHYSRDAYAKLRSLKAAVKYNEYPGVGHFCWNNAFKDKALIQWIMKQKK